MTQKQSSRSGRRKAGAYTIHDVAALAGVSSITVSRYFNSPEKVSAGLREKLRELIDRIGYVPSQVAGGLASGHGRVVCAVMQNIASATFADLVKGMTDQLQASGLQLLLANAQYSQQLEEQAIRTFIGWHPTALILTRHDHTPAAEAMLRALNIPVVEAWGFVPGRPFHQVGFPHTETGAILARHILEQGATRIQFVMSDSAEDFRSRQRAQGYREAMEAAGLPADVAVLSEADEFELGAKSIAALATQPVSIRPQALIFANDNMAAGAILHAPQCGLVLPRDCAITGFGDAPISARLRPALTTLRPARYQIGEQAAQTVLNQLMLSPKAEREIIEKALPCELLVRESSRVML